MRRNLIFIKNNKKHIYMQIFYRVSHAAFLIFLFNNIMLKMDFYKKKNDLNYV
jgi:hypothetical protein